MKNRLLTYCSAFLCISTMATAGFSATIGEKSGTATGEFLRLGAGARAAAMGEAFAATADDVHSLYWNPSGLAKVSSRQLLVAHTMWYMDVNHEYAAYVHPFGNGRGAAGISATYLTTSFEKRAGDTDAPDSNGSVGDMAIGISYGRPLVWGINGGLTAKYISSSLDTYSATGFGIDAGLQYTLPCWQKLTMGFAVTNLGGSLKYIDKSVAIGNTADFGLAVSDAYFKNLRLALDARTLINNNAMSLNTGAEYVWQFKNGLSLAPRIGFQSYDARVTAGFGLNWKTYQLDYALVPHVDLGSTNRISFGLKF